MTCSSRVIVGAILGVSVAASAPAAAIPPPPPIDVVLVEATRDGVMSLPDYYTRDGQLLVEVETEAGDAVEGTSGVVERTADGVTRRLVWRPAVVLEPGASYRVRVYRSPYVNAAFELADELTLLVLDEDAAPPEAPAVEWAAANEREVVALHHCCDPTLAPPPWGSTEPPFEHCWAQAYEYPVELEVAWLPSPAAQAGRVLYEIVPAAGATLRPRPFQANLEIERRAAVVFPSGTGRACVDLVAHDVVTGGAARTPICDDADVGLLPRPPREVPDLEVCEGDLVVPGTGVLVEKKPGVEASDGAGGGCTTGGGGGGLIVGLLALAHAARARRRRR
jgi:MYXO-CTERM domain-containing protein